MFDNSHFTRSLELELKDEGGKLPEAIVLVPGSVMTTHHSRVAFPSGNRFHLLLDYAGGDPVAYSHSQDNWRIVLGNTDLGTGDSNKLRNGWSVKLQERSDKSAGYTTTFGAIDDCRIYRAPERLFCGALVYLRNKLDAQALSMGSVADTLLAGGLVFRQHDEHRWFYYAPEGLALAREPYCLVLKKQNTSWVASIRDPEMPFVGESANPSEAVERLCLHLQIHKDLMTRCVDLLEGRD